MNAYRYQSPPNWPAPPEGWVPPEGWRPPPDWPPAPEDWQFWVLAQAPEAESRRDRAALRTQGAGPPSPSVPTESNGADIPMFGARKRARELAASAEALRAENEHLRAELARTGALDAATIELERTAAQRRFEEERAQHARVLEGLASEHREARNAVDPRALDRLQEAARRGENTFAALMDAVRSHSLGQITHALYQVGGQYRRSM